MDKKSLKVAISLRINPGRGGGYEQALLGLIYGLGHLTDGDEEYIILTNRNAAEWINPYLTARQHLVEVPEKRIKKRIRAVANLLPSTKFILKPIWHSLISLRKMLSPSFQIKEPPKSNGYLETLGVDVLFIADAKLIQTSIPTIYNPHDLQHLNFPEFYTHQERVRRGIFYEFGCKNYEAVATPAYSVKKDVVTYYNVPEQKVWVIPWASSITLYPPITQSIVDKKKKLLKLPDSFAFYPAQTWIHKNHLRLLETLALLRSKYGISLNLVCTGYKNAYWQEIAEFIKYLKLEEQVHFLGFVSTEEIRVIYQLCDFLVYPSLHEGAGLPILEAFSEGVPVACSKVTSLPEYAGDAALFFNPYSVESITEALLRMVTDKNLRNRLKELGKKRAGVFSWDRTARSYRALFRYVAGKPLSFEDDTLMAESCRGSNPLK